MEHTAKIPTSYAQLKHNIKSHYNVYLKVLKSSNSM